jgi:hypothetical protein
MRNSPQDWGLGVDALPYAKASNFHYKTGQESLTLRAASPFLTAFSVSVKGCLRV